MTSDVSFRFVWGVDDPKIKGNVRQFWRDLDVLGPEHIEDRVNELCVVAYADDKLIAVSTAAIAHFPRLKSRLAFYRAAVAPEYRRQDLGWRITAYSRNSLEKWSLEHPDENLMGLLAVFQAEELKGVQRLPIITRHGFSFIFAGCTPAGEQMRVIWFEHATLE